MTDKSDMLTTDQAAKLLGVNRAAVARWLRLGQLRGVRLPFGHWRVRREDLDRLLADQSEHPP
jgi:excisionase family DNA binding protein